MHAGIMHSHRDHHRRAVWAVLISVAMKHFVDVPYPHGIEAVSSGCFSNALVTSRSTAPQKLCCSLQPRGTKAGPLGASVPHSTALLDLQRARGVCSCRILQVACPQPLSLETLQVWPWKIHSTLFYRFLRSLGVAWGHGFYCVSDIPHSCKGQSFNGPSVYGLLMLYHVPSKTMAPIMFLTHFPSDSLKPCMCDVNILMQ